MRTDISDITVVLDRSGSMHTCQSDAEGGLNSYIQQQKKQSGAAIFTLVQFDTEYEFVHNGIPIAQVPYCSLVPRGSTALLDAVGRAIVETGERLSKMPEDERPGLVVFVIITDGQENSSREFSLAKVKEMIQHQQDVYKWQFIYLGANQDAFAEAGALGIAGSIGNMSVDRHQAAWAAASATTSRMRDHAMNREPVANFFTSTEMTDMKNDEEK